MVINNNTRFTWGEVNNRLWLLGWNPRRILALHRALRGTIGDPVGNTRSFTWLNLNAALCRMGYAPRYILHNVLPAMR